MGRAGGGSLSHGAVPAPPGPPYIAPSTCGRRSAPRPPPPIALVPWKLALAYVVTARVNVAEVRWQDAFMSSYVTCFLQMRRTARQKRWWKARGQGRWKSCCNRIGPTAFLPSKASFFMHGCFLPFQFAPSSVVAFEFGWCTLFAGLGHPLGVSKRRKDAVVAAAAVCIPGAQDLLNQLLVC